jgi:hypothetical protein
MGPCWPTTAAGGSDRRVLGGGEVFGREEQVLHGLQDMLFPLVGDVHQEKWWSMASGQEWRGRGGMLMFPARGQ